MPFLHRLRRLRRGRDLLNVGAPFSSVVAKIHAFDRSTGRERWTHPAGPGVWGAIAGDAKSAFAIKGEKELVALDLESGALRSSFPITVWGWLGPAALGGRGFHPPRPMLCARPWAVD